MALWKSVYKQIDQIYRKISDDYEFTGGLAQPLLINQGKGRIHDQSRGNDIVRVSYCRDNHRRGRDCTHSPRNQFLVPHSLLNRKAARFRA